MISKQVTDAWAMATAGGKVTCMAKLVVSIRSVNWWMTRQTLDRNCC